MPEPDQQGFKHKTYKMMNEQKKGAKKTQIP